MPRGERGRGERAAEPLRLLRPLADLARRQRVLLRPCRGRPGGPVGVKQLPNRPSVSCARTDALAEPDPEVDLLGPEVLGPHVLVDLLQVLTPAGPAVGGGVESRRPLHRRVRPVRDPQVHLGVLHPDRREGHGDVGGERLALVWRGELVGHRRHPVVRPRVRVGEQHPVVEVPDGQAVASLRPLVTTSPSCRSWLLLTGRRPGRRPAPRTARCRRRASGAERGGAGGGHRQHVVPGDADDRRDRPRATDSACSTSVSERRLTPLITVTDCIARSACPLLSSQSRVSASAAAASPLAGTTTTSWSVTFSSRVRPAAPGSSTVSG